MNPVTASDAELEVLGEGLKRNTALQNFLNRDPEQDSNLFPELNFSFDPTKGISDLGGGLESYFGTTESAMEDPLNAKNVLTAATQSANADEFNDVIRSLQRSKEELEGEFLVMNFLLSHLTINLLHHFFLQEVEIHLMS